MELQLIEQYLCMILQLVFESWLARTALETEFAGDDEDESNMDDEDDVEYLSRLYRLRFELCKAILIPVYHSVTDEAQFAEFWDALNSLLEELRTNHPQKFDEFFEKLHNVEDTPFTWPNATPEAPSFPLDLDSHATPDPRGHFQYFLKSVLNPEVQEYLNHE